MTANLPVVLLQHGLVRLRDLHGRDDRALGPALLRPHLRVRRADAAHRRGRAETFQFEIPPALEQRAGYIKYAILFGAIGYYLATREIAFYRYIEPFWMFTFDATPVLWIVVGVLLVASVFVRNLYCRFLCPLGAALGLVSSVTTVFKIKRWSECSQCALCEKTCEWGAIRKRQIIKAECVRCDDCEILYDDKQRCPHWLLELKRKVRAVVGGGAA